MFVGALQRDETAFILAFWQSTVYLQAVMNIKNTAVTVEQPGLGRDTHQENT